METKYVKLSELVGSTFTVKHVHGYKWKMWDNGTKKMVVQDNWFKGASKKYQVETDKGMLDLGSGQLSSLLEAVFRDGLADINLTTFEVNSNGKTGMDIRYFFKEVKEGHNEDLLVDSEVNTEEIPF